MISGFSIWAVLGQIEAAGEPNWTLIIGIGIVFLVLLVLLLLPPKKTRAIEDGKKKAIQDKAADGASPEADRNKDQLSLAEIKEAKRTVVSDEKSKDEMRELRKERRAAVQTEKAVRGREEVAETEKEAAAEAEEKADKGVNPFDDVLTNADSNAGDVFASLFGAGSKDSEFSLDADLGLASPSTEGKVAFPTLGSALIPLSDFAKDETAEAKEDPLDELTKRLAAKAEKKTLK